MSKFVIKNIEGISGRQLFKQVIIVDDSEDAEKLQSEINSAEANNRDVGINGVMDDYENALEDRYRSSFRGILAIMDLVANLKSVSKDKFKDVTPRNDLVKEYEFKFQDLRVLGIQIFGGKLILLCGYKNQQKPDFNKFRSLKKQYLEYIKQKNEKKRSTK